MILNQIQLQDCKKFIKLIPDNSVDLIVIDPPYNELPLNWDNFNDWEYLKNEFDRILQKHGQMYVFGKQPMLSQVYHILRNNFDFRFDMLFQQYRTLFQSMSCVGKLVGV